MLRIAMATAAAVGLITSPLASADVTASIGIDYSTGKYGASDSTDMWTTPVMVKYEGGPVILKLTVPYVRVSGTVNRDTGTTTVTTRRTEEGLGDVVASAAYNVLSMGGAGLDIGGKVKFATADKDKTLLTTGENDYSLQADAYHTFGALTGFATLGWTKKGDPDGVDFRNPWYTSVGAAYKISDALRAGAFYDYRAKVIDGGSPISEATFFVTNAFTKSWKLQGYVVTGFSNGSPDWGAGAVLGYTY